MLTPITAKQPVEKAFKIVQYRKVLRNSIKEYGSLTNSLSRRVSLSHIIMY